MSWAKTNQYSISLEYLDFEYCKKYARGKLYSAPSGFRNFSTGTFSENLAVRSIGAILHTLPYKKIRAKFERECCKSGVKLVYVKPEYTSVLGNLIATKHSFLSRDSAAAMVIALRALQGGNAYLNALCLEVKTLRLNVKGLFGQQVRVSGLPVGKIDTTGRVYAIQTQAGRSIITLMDAMRAAYLSDRSLLCIRTRWKVTFNEHRLTSIDVGCRNPDGCSSQSTSKSLAALNEHFKKNQIFEMFNFEQKV